MLAPDTVHFSWDTRIAAGATIEPFVVFAPGVSVATGAVIRAFSHLEGAKVGEDALIGPYARLRPGAASTEAPTPKPWLLCWERLSAAISPNPLPSKGLKAPTSILNWLSAVVLMLPKL